MGRGKTDRRSEFEGLQSPGAGRGDFVLARERRQREGSRTGTGAKTEAAAVGVALSASLRAQRSNPSRNNKKEWIASSQGLLAMTLMGRRLSETPHPRRPGLEPGPIILVICCYEKFVQHRA